MLLSSISPSSQTTYFVCQQLISSDLNRFVSHGGLFSSLQRKSHIIYKGDIITMAPYVYIISNNSPIPGFIIFVKKNKKIPKK